MPNPKTWCDTCETARIPGVLLGWDTPDGIQRCDECGVYPGDLEAARAAAATIPGGTVWYEDPSGKDRQWQGEPDAVIASETNPWVRGADGEPIDWQASLTTT